MPILAARPCLIQGCRIAAVSGGRCAAHQRAADRMRGTSTDRGYGAAWRRIRNPWIAAHFVCADPFGLHAGVIRKAEVRDHWLARKDGGTDDDSNACSLCGQCHNHKRQREARGIVEGPRPRCCGRDEHRSLAWQLR